MPGETRDEILTRLSKERDEFRRLVIWAQPWMQIIMDSFGEATEWFKEARDALERTSPPSEVLKKEGWIISAHRTSWRGMLVIITRDPDYKVEDNNWVQALRALVTGGDRKSSSSIEKPPGSAPP